MEMEETVFIGETWFGRGEKRGGATPPKPDVEKRSGMSRVLNVLLSKRNGWPMQCPN
jgi:hypothetical protein